MPAPSLNRVRLFTLLLPPVGLVLLWRQPGSGLGRKVAGTLFILLYGVLHAAGVVWLLMQVTPLEVEWRGGFPPVLTFHKTKTDYAAIEAHRSRQTNAGGGAAAAAGLAGVRWTDFRGPNRDGLAAGPLVVPWPAAGLPLLWRQPVGGGYASFVIADGRAFTIEQRRDREVVTAYDLATGREIWAHGYAALFSESMGGDGPRATPTWHEGRLYSLGAVGEFCCLDAASGRVLWRKNLLDEVEGHAANGLYFGLSASPLMVDDLVVALSGEPLGAVKGKPRHGVLAFEQRTGVLRWSALPEKMAYVSPMLVTLAGERQILVVTSTRACGLRPSDGTLLWETPWKVQYDNAIAQPVLVSSNRFLLAAGYGTGCALIELARAGDGRLTAQQLWKNQNLKNKFNSSVFHEGHVYGLDEGILTCLDAATGRRVWKDGRYGYGQLLLAGNHLVVLSGEGDLVLVKATPEGHQEVSRFAAIPGKTWNHPVLAGGYLLVRNAAEMACFRVGP
ncbi:MAG: hypothetical protein RJA22_590 [Verrucomicrobiota bacterium]